MSELYDTGLTNFSGDRVRLHIPEGFEVLKEGTFQAGDRFVKGGNSGLKMSSSNVTWLPMEPMFFGDDVNALTTVVIRPATKES